MEQHRTAVYIDGLNLFYGAIKGTENKWLDIEAFVRHLLPQDEIAQIRYFTAVVNARTDNPHIQVRQETYLRALATLPSVIVHRGRFTRRVGTKVLADEFEHHRELFDPYFRPRFLYSLMWRDKVRRRSGSNTRVRVVLEEEKGSDVNLGVFLVSDAARGSIDKAVIISNDSDITEAINLAKEFGIKVGILNPHSSPTSKHLRIAAEFEIPFRASVLAQFQLPNVIRDKKGREIHRPKDWRKTQRPVLSNGPRAHSPK